MKLKVLEKYGKNTWVNREVVLMVPRKEKHASIQSFLLIVFSCLLLSAAACQEPDPSGLPDKEAVKTYEALYGKTLDDVLKALALSEDEISETPYTGLWMLSKPRMLAEHEFQEALLFDTAKEPEIMYGFQYLMSTDDSGELFTVTERLFSEATDIYGEPVTYPGLSNTLSSNASLSAIKEGEKGQWLEEWQAGESSSMTLSVTVPDSGSANISLVYRIPLTLSVP